MILKAGTYTFNNTLTEGTFEQSIDISITAAVDDDAAIVNISKLQGIIGDYFSLSSTIDSLIVNGEEQVEEPTLMGIYNSRDKIWVLPIQTHTITKDTEVNETFGTWYIANTNYNEVINPPLAEITYNGETIAKINAGETVILKCEGLLMETDIILKVNG